jgi:type II secretory pathway pseudopilin PulG
MKSDAGPAACARQNGFSLVEVALATGLFAFVVVGIIAMFPAGMKQQSFSAMENVGVNAARQILAAAAVATNASEIRLITGSTNKAVKDLAASPLVLGFAAGSMVPERDFGSGGALAWQSGTEASVHVLVRARLEPRADGLQLLRVEASAPAAAPLTNRRVETFTTLLAFP